MRDLTSRERFILGGCTAMAVLTFFPWFSLGGSREMAEMFEAMGASFTGFNDGFGIAAFVAAIGTGALVLADRAGALPWEPAARLLAPLASVGVAALCLLISMGRGSSPMVSRTFWFYLALGGIAFAGFHAFQRWTEGSKAAGTPQPPPGAGPTPHA
jgi:hypothetical protein